MKVFMLKYGFWIGIAIFIILVIWNINVSDRELKKNGILLNAVLVDIVHVYNGSSEYRYQFSFAGQVYLQEDAVGIKKLNRFIGKSFPIMFSPKLKDSKLLMTPEDFEKFNIPFPDSLKWVLRFRNN